MNLHNPGRDNAQPKNTARRQWLQAGAALWLTGCSRQDEPVATVASPALAAPASAASPIAVNDPHIRVEAMLLPGLVNSATDGSLIDLLQAMAKQYPQGRFLISAAPVMRVTEDVTQGVADLGFPTLRLRMGGDEKLPYQYSTASFGTANFVLYSNKKKPLTRTLIEQNQAQNKAKLLIEAPGFEWGFPVEQFTSLESALRKVEAGRLDAFLWAQEEADTVLKQLKITNIVRASYGDFDDVFLRTRGPRGDFVDGVVTATLLKLRQSGELEALYRRIHLPHNPWQP